MTKQNDEKEIVRQWRLLSYLFRSSWPRSRRELAERFGVVKKTIGRDIDDLVRAGFPILTRKEGQTDTYLIDPDFRALPPTTLTPLELMALHLARAEIQCLAETPFRDELEGLCDKVAVLLPQEARQYCEKIERFARPHVRGRKRASARPHVLARLRTAILESRSCEVRYRAPGRAKDSVFTIQPQRLLTHHGGLYLIAWNTRFEQFNTLATERIRAVRPLEKIFAPRPEAEIEAEYEQAFGIYAADPFAIKLRFAPEVAPYVAERSWHPSERMRTNPDGSLTYTATASGKLEVESWVLSYGAKVEVVEPEWIRDRVAEHAAAMAERYLGLSAGTARTGT